MVDFTLVIVLLLLLSVAHACNDQSTVLAKEF